MPILHAWPLGGIYPVFCTRQRYLLVGTTPQGKDAWFGSKSMQTQDVGDLALDDDMYQVYTYSRYWQEYDVFEGGLWGLRTVHGAFADPDEDLYDVDTQFREKTVLHVYKGILAGRYLYQEIIGGPLMQLEAAPWPHESGSGTDASGTRKRSGGDAGPSREWAPKYRKTTAPTGSERAHYGTTKPDNDAGATSVKDRSDATIESGNDTARLDQTRGAGSVAPESREPMDRKYEKETVITTPAASALGAFLLSFCSRYEHVVGLAYSGDLKVAHNEIEFYRNPAALSMAGHGFLSIIERYHNDLVTAQDLQWVAHDRVKDVDTTPAIVRHISDLDDLLLERVAAINDEIEEVKAALYDFEKTVAA